MKKTSYKQKIKKEIRDELMDIQLEREEAEQRRLEAESEWSKAYEEDFRREQEREYDKFLSEDQYELYPHDSFEIT